MRRFRILLVVLLVAVIGGLAWEVSRPREMEPAYQGKTLSQWVATKTPTDFDPSISTPAIEAVRQIGTNLLIVLNDPDIKVRKEATNALKLINPEAAARAGVN